MGDFVGTQKPPRKLDCAEEDREGVVEACGGCRIVEVVVAEPPGNLRSVEHAEALSENLTASIGRGTQNLAVLRTTMLG